MIHQQTFSRLSIFKLLQGCNNISLNLNLSLRHFFFPFSPSCLTYVLYRIKTKMLTFSGIKFCSFASLGYWLLMLNWFLLIWHKTLPLAKITKVTCYYSEDINDTLANECHQFKEYFQLIIPHMYKLKILKFTWERNMKEFIPSWTTILKLYMTFLISY